MFQNKNLKQSQLMTLTNKKCMIDLLQQYCKNGSNCLCLLKTTSKESLIQKLLLQEAKVNLDITLTKQDYKCLIKAMHDMCSWNLYIDKFQTLAKTNNKIKKLKPDCVFIELEHNNTIQEHFKTMAKKRQVDIILTSYNNENFYDDGIHTLKKSFKKSEVKITIDFIDKNVKIDTILPKKEIIKENNNAKIQEINPPKSYRILNKNFKITNDFKAIVIDNQTHNIPDYFNIDMLKDEDEKTWQMIFYELFSVEISNAIIKGEY